MRRHCSDTQQFFQSFLAFLVLLSSNRDRIGIGFGKSHVIGYTFLPMKVRNAKISDVSAIYSLINYYCAERDKMLFRSMADIYENLQAFAVAELDGSVVGGKLCAW